MTTDMAPGIHRVKESFQQTHEEFEPFDAEHILLGKEGGDRA